MWRVAAALIAVVVAAPASAQQLTLDIRDGLVTLDATNAPVRQILAEWARIGGTRVVGGERISAPPLTLKLEGVPEAKALDIVLRGAAGYMAATRPVAGAGRSSYDRILILATSSAPSGGAAPGGNAAGGMRAPNRFTPPQATEPQDSTDVPDSPVEPPTNPFANAFGQPGMTPPANPFTQPQQNPFGQPVQNPFGQPVQNPFGQPVPNPFGQPLTPAAPGQGGSIFTPMPQQPGSAPAGLFGTGAAVPGVVQPAPDPQGTRPRPPGR